MRTEEELDYLETLIPDLVVSATKKAYLDALSSGSSVMEVVDGEIVSTAPNGVRTFIKKAPTPILVKDLINETS